MPKFLEDKLKKEYGSESDVPYKVMNKIGAMHGNKETAKGREMEAKHERDLGHDGAHPGFKAVQSKIAEKEGVSEDRAGAILASSSRHASPAAKKANPRLNKVLGHDGFT